MLCRQYGNFVCRILVQIQVVLYEQLQFYFHLLIGFLSGYLSCFMPKYCCHLTADCGIEHLFSNMVDSGI
ncbi:hypothetical protein VNO77_16215 [Canavalia gladiata]|uniref:Uncharacterized protein n=1 Tax=Canavalia gladiata TaxID=3824 RepID=A0AAN9M5G4_CANGL